MRPGWAWRTQPLCRSRPERGGGTAPPPGTWPAGPGLSGRDPGGHRRHPVHHPGGAELRQATTSCCGGAGGCVGPEDGVATERRGAPWCQRQAGRHDSDRRHTGRSGATGGTMPPCSTGACQLADGDGRGSRAGERSAPLPVGGQPGPLCPSGRGADLRCPCRKAAGAPADLPLEPPLPVQKGVGSAPSGGGGGRGRPGRSPLVCGGGPQGPGGAGGGACSGGCWTVWKNFEQKEAA